ncbi:MAG: nicotinate-nucleotide adenylyltransferase [Clostridia bacterium]|nr:nicotinate-nucleotide adenylyltransferase [Clostridia bacterium]
MELIGILGGTFDPIHTGHTRMAQAFVNKTGVRRVLFIPDGSPPHKSGLADANDRLEMCRIATREYPGFEPCDIEIRRAGTTYTFETLRELKKRVPDAGFIYIVGSDTMMIIETWKNFAEVAKMVRSIAVIPRPGDDRDALMRHKGRLFERYGVKIDILPCEVSDVSSSQIRFRLARFLPVSGMVEPEVEKYIKSHKLYRDDMLTSLKRTMTPARYRHTLGVEKTAVKMAGIFGEDEDKARTAALLHDCAKHMSVNDMCALVDEYGISTAAGERDSRALLHAAAGMALAQKQYAQTDPDILSAIRWHTTGKVGMNKLDKIIYLADMTEPGRRSFAGLDDIRKAAMTDLDKAMALAARRTVEYVKNRGMPLNERTVELLESIGEN